MRDVDDLHHAEGERQAAGDQEQQRRGEQAVEGLGDEVGHETKGRLKAAPTFHESVFNGLLPAAAAAAAAGGRASARSGARAGAGGGGGIPSTSGARIGARLVHVAAADANRANQLVLQHDRHAAGHEVVRQALLAAEVSPDQSAFDVGKRSATALEVERAYSAVFAFIRPVSTPIGTTPSMTWASTMSPFGARTKMA